MSEEHQVTAQIPREFADIVLEAGSAIETMETTSIRGGLADIGPYAAVIATEAAAVVTLLDAPNVVRRLARWLRQRNKGEYWLTARGPGGELTMNMNSPVSEEVLASLLLALWNVREDQPNTDEHAASPGETD